MGFGSIGRSGVAWTAGLVAGVLLSANQAWAEAASDGWQFSMTPYIWATSLNGDVTVRGRSASVDAPFTEVLGKASSLFGYSDDLELSHGPWTLFLAPSYMKVSMEESASVGPLSLAAEATSELLFLEFGGAYRVTAWGSGGARGTAAGGALELLAGGRYTDLDAEIELEVPPAGVARTVDESKDWVDPFIGVRLKTRVSDNWFLHLRGDVGGFGVGSDFSAQGIASVGYEFDMFGHAAAAFGGYRALYQDYTDGSGASRFKWDMTIHGPILGMRVTF